jgi:hypothetical protein
MMKSNSIQIMPNEVVEYLSLAQVANLCSISQEEAKELIEYGAIHFDRMVADEGFLSITRLEPLRVACKLRQDYDLDLFTVAISVGHLETIAGLERQLQSCRALIQSL